jgi:hypothetical protein
MTVTGNTRDSISENTNINFPTIEDCTMKFTNAIQTEDDSAQLKLMVYWLERENKSEI